MAKLAKDANVISHWHYPIENFQTSTMEFYAAVEQALKPHEIPDYSVSRIDWREGGVLTARREYLRIKRGKLAFDICAAPFGTGFFFSSWLAELPPSHLILWLLALFVGWLAVIGICVEMFGQSGFFPGIFAYLGLIWLLGYLIREERLGTEAEDICLSHPVPRWPLPKTLPATHLLPDRHYAHVSGRGAQDSNRRGRSVIVGKGYTCPHRA